MYNRLDLVNILKPWVYAHPSIIAAWEGGSAATNRMDEFSDLDLSIVAIDDQIEVIFADLESFMKKHFTILRKYRVPEPAWHGVSQCFYQIDKVTPHIYLDIAVIKESQPDKLMEKDRHGLATLWFDRKNIYNPTPSQAKDIIERGKKLFSSVIHTDFIIIIEIEKGITRGHFIDVFPTYFSFISRHIAIMMNLKYRPEKADFGLRYGRIDYDLSDVKLIEEAMKVATIEQLKVQFEQLLNRYQALKEELSKTWQ
ncbi:MAG: hypothetical protein C4543_01765 [Ignavibacteriales bacterium]|jgi:predicted nucleotidyltransferase|nr:MAG: hypothetical protein C4543_01765 [Ignavibacteriales bacterium]